MSNVDKAMYLADKYAVSANSDGQNDCDSNATEAKRKILRAHLEAMEADRVRLLEALQKMYTAWRGTEWRCIEQREACELAEKEIAKATGETK